MRLQCFLVNALGLMLASNVSAFSLGDECFACSTAAENAMVVDATNGLRTELTYFVIDRGQDQLRKFLIFYTPGGIPLSPEQQKLYFKKLRDSEKDPQQGAGFNLPDHTIAEVQPFSSELTLFADYKLMLDEVFGITGPLRARSMSAGLEVNLPLGAVRDINTAFDVRTNRDDLDIGLWIQNNNPIISFTLITIDKLSQLFSNSFVVDFEFEVIVNFPDGSIGLWKLNELNELDLVEGSLRDNDQNEIPRRQTEVNVNGSFFFRGGESSTNASNQLSVADRLLFGAPGGGSGGSGCGWSCDEQSCTLICRTE
ncbi:MAG: hypothetical protein Tsb0027_15640 [Wenzhouxiangellaceae bacterium]